MHKKGLELSINFIVMLILALVIFSFGIYFVNRILRASQEQVESLPKTEEIVLDQCINQGNSICLPNNRKEIHIGKSGVFGLAIVNNFGEKKDFSVNIGISMAIDENNNDITAAIEASQWTFTTHGPIELDNLKAEKISIPIVVPYGTPRGEYAFNVNVCFDDGDPATETLDKCTGTFKDLYETTHKIRVTVS